ncbi:MAG: sulfatase-like hydrolase/transferase [Candidatus Asgardarchaeia archaeon]
MKKINVIFIVLDTLRKDYAKEMEEQLSKNGFIIYDKVIAPASWTTPVHASIFTGEYPIIHGAHETLERKISNVKLKRKDTLIKYLNDLGYTTYLLTANTLITPYFGFRGFDKVFFYFPRVHFTIPQEDFNTLKTLEKKVRGSKLKLLLLLIKQGKFRLIFEGAIHVLVSKLRPLLILVYSIVRKWPRNKGINYFINKISKMSFSEPFFIFANFMEMHEPYTVRERDYKEIIKSIKTGRVDQRYIEKWRREYPRHAKYLAKKISQLIEVLKEKKIFHDSLIIITSDHGQMLGENGLMGHGRYLRDELLEVPLMIKYPDNISIEFYHKKRNDLYISLKNLRGLIEDIIEGKYSDQALYSACVYAESYGIQYDNVKPENLHEEENIRKLEKYRVAIYFKGMKAIFNVTDNVIESIESAKKQRVQEAEIEELKKRLKKFLTLRKISRIRKKIFTNLS